MRSSLTVNRNVLHLSPFLYLDFNYPKEAKKKKLQMQKIQFFFRLEAPQNKLLQPNGVLPIY